MKALTLSIALLISCISVSAQQIKPVSIPCTLRDTKINMPVMVVSEIPVHFISVRCLIVQAHGITIKLTASEVNDMISIIKDDNTSKVLRSNPGTIRNNELADMIIAIFSKQTKFQLANI